MDDVAVHGRQATSLVKTSEEMYGRILWIFLPSMGGMQHTEAKVMQHTEAKVWGHLVGGMAPTNRWAEIKHGNYSGRADLLSFLKPYFIT